MTAQQASPPPDGIELVGTGTARFIVDGEVWRLRRPKLGEFKKLREMLHELEDARMQILRRQQADQPAADAEADADAKVERLLAVNHQARQVSDEVTALNLGWLETALAMLADRPLPPTDDWPSGMDSPGTIAELVEHWRTRPLRSGGS